LARAASINLWYGSERRARRRRRLVSTKQESTANLIVVLVDPRGGDRRGAVESCWRTEQESRARRESVPAFAVARLPLSALPPARRGVVQRTPPVAHHASTCAASSSGTLSLITIVQTLARSSRMLLLGGHNKLTCTWNKKGHGRSRALKSFSRCLHGETLSPELHP
jgi:hypothetical protein